MLRELRDLVKAEGLTVHPIKTRAWYLRSYGFSPDVVIDVGVENGTRWLYEAWPDAKLVLVDPLSESRERVAQCCAGRDFAFHNVALGATHDTMSLQVPETEKGIRLAMSSLLSRQGGIVGKFTNVIKRDVKVVPLDELAAAYPGRVGLKIDTEGFEGPVLEGGAVTLKRCDVVILEMSVTQRFAGVSPPSHLVRMLSDAGLEMRDILSIADGPQPRAKPRYMDVMFTRWEDQSE